MIQKEENKYTIEDCHKKFAVELNNLVWNLLEKRARTGEEDEEMIHAAHGSCYHWGKIGEPINLQRGEWLISHVYAVLNRAEPSLYHAHKCMEITNEHNFIDFDLAFAYEGMARAYAVNGEESECEKYIKLAIEAGEKIERKGDRELFFNDFESEPWYGMK